MSMWDSVAESMCVCVGGGGAPPEYKQAANPAPKSVVKTQQLLNKYLWSENKWMCIQKEINMEKF